MTAFGFFLFAYCGCFVVRMSEVWVHRRHQRWVLAQGGSEQGGGWPRLVFVASILLPTLAVVEHALRLTIPTDPLIRAGLIIVPLGLILRLWAMRSLGPFWTIGDAEIVGYPRRLNVGPYRYCDRPDLWAWLLEAVALCAILGAMFSVLVNILVLLFFIAMATRSIALRLTASDGTSNVARPVRLR